MGYVVLHMSKAKGNDSRMTAHIERTVEPKNADKNRTHLNRELIEFPEGITNRTQAIQHRIETANIKRKITKDQVRVIRINLSGSPEDMKRIEAERQIDEWCRDNLDYLKKKFGEKNIVSAVLHMDEKTPHIHASLVPIVEGARRKAKEGAKKKNTIRLCADDVMTKTKLEGYQDTYAEAMAKYGLERGIRGSEAKHVTTAEFYRDVFEQAENAKVERDFILQQNEEKQQAVKMLQEKEAMEQQRLATLQMEADKKQKEVEEKQRLVQKAKNEVTALGVEKAFKEAGKGVLEGISSLVGNSKAKKLEMENKGLKQEIETLQVEKEDITKQAQRDIAEKNKLILEKDSLIVTQKGKMDKLFDYFPILNEYDFIMRLCEVCII